MTKDLKIQDLETKLDLALTRINELEALVLKLSTTKTSTNSSISPSTDLSRKNQSLREKSNKPVGGQEGHKGFGLKMSKTPEFIQSIYPDFCNLCGISLAGSNFEMVARLQVVDIPPIFPTTTEFQYSNVLLPSVSVDIIKQELFQKPLKNLFNMVKIYRH